MGNVLEAVSLRPTRTPTSGLRAIVQLHYVKDELMPIEAA